MGPGLGKPGPFAVSRGKLQSAARVPEIPWDKVEVILQSTVAEVAAACGFLLFPVPGPPLLYQYLLGVPPE